MTDRTKDLQADLAAIPEKDRCDMAAENIKFRLKFLSDAIQTYRGKPLRTGIRWSRFFFGVTYLHTISGSMYLDLKGKLGDLSIVDKPTKPEKWLVEYHIGFFDSDAMSCYIFGNLKIPVTFDNDIATVS